MNWGHKITLGLILFVVFLAGMVTISMRTDFFLVEENYYEEELAYQQKIESQKNGNAWTKKITISEGTDVLQIHFEEASSVDSGSVNFFRPSDARLDFTYPLTEQLTLPKKQLLKGKWIVKFRWEISGKKYVKEETLFIES